MLYKLGDHVLRFFRDNPGFVPVLYFIQLSKFPNSHFFSEKYGLKLNLLLTMSKNYKNPSVIRKCYIRIKMSKFNKNMH